MTANLKAASADKASAPGATGNVGEAGDTSSSTPTIAATDAHPTPLSVTLLNEGRKDHILRQ